MALKKNTGLVFLGDKIIQFTNFEISELSASYREASLTIYVDRAENMEIMCGYSIDDFMDLVNINSDNTNVTYNDHRSWINRVKESIKKIKPDKKEYPDKNIMQKKEKIDYRSEILDI